jgi:hypothetical protein
MNLYDCVSELDDQTKSYRKFLIDSNKYSASQIVQMHMDFSEVVADHLANLIEDFNERHRFKFIIQLGKVKFIKELEQIKEAEKNGKKIKIK